MAPLCLPLRALPVGLRPALRLLAWFRLYCPLLARALWRLLSLGKARMRGRPAHVEIALRLDESVSGCHFLAVTLIIVVLSEFPIEPREHRKLKFPKLDRKANSDGTRARFCVLFWHAVGGAVTAAFLAISCILAALSERTFSELFQCCMYRMCVL